MNKIEYELYQVKRDAEHRDLLFSNMKLIDKLKLNIEQQIKDKNWSKKFGDVKCRTLPG